MMDDDEWKAKSPAVVRRDVDQAQREILRELWDASKETLKKIDDRATITENLISFHLRGRFFAVFVPAFLAVVAGGYVVKYWL